MKIWAGDTDAEGVWIEMTSEARGEKDIRKCVEWESESQELNSEEYLHLKNAVERDASKEQQSNQRGKRKTKRLSQNPRRGFQDEGNRHCVEFCSLEN